MGTAEYETENGKFSLSAGDMIFIPCGAKYSSHFRGENIRYKNFICIFSPDFPSNAQNSAVFPMQVINCKNPASYAELDGISTLYSRGDFFGAAAKFYSLYGKLLDKMDFKVIKNSTSPIEPAVSYIAEHVSENFRIEQLADLCAISESYLFRLFEKEYGCSPVEYRNRLRVRNAIFMLESGKYTVSAVSEALGFSTDEYFSRTFKKMTGRTPSSYKLS